MIVKGLGAEAPSPPRLLGVAFNLLLDVGQARHKYQYDGTARTAAARLQNNLLTGLVPPWAPWFRLTPGIDTQFAIEEDKDPDKTRSAIQRSLDIASDVVLTHLHSSNFYRVMGECFTDMIVAAGIIAIEPDDDRETITFVDVPIDQAAIVADEHGDVQYVYHQFRMLNRSIIERYGDRLTATTLKALSADDLGQSTIMVAVEYDKERDKYIKRKFFWARDNQNTHTSTTPQHAPMMKESSLLEESELDYNPFIVARWSALPNNPYGEGPALKALADMRTLNTVMQAFLQRLALEANGAWTAVDDDVFDPYTLDIRAGTVIPVSSNDHTNPSIRRLDVPGNVQAVGLGIEDLRANIRDQFFEDRLTQAGRTPLTATEILERSDAVAREMGASFGILTSEFLIPLIRTTMMILSGYEKYKDLFDGIELDGVDYTIEFLGTIARAQRKREGNEMLSILSTSGQMGSLYPELPLMLKNTEIAREAFSNLGVEDKFIRNNSELQEELQKAQEGAQFTNQLAGQTGTVDVGQGQGQATQ